MPQEAQPSRFAPFLCQKKLSRGRLPHFETRCRALLNEWHNPRDTMCQRMHPRVRYKCRHEVEQLSYIVQCSDAKERGSDCEDPTDNYSLGISSKKGDCPDCEESDGET